MLCNVAIAQSIEVFTLTHKPISLLGSETLVCQMDSFQKIESRLGDVLNPQMKTQEIASVVADFEPQIEKTVACQQRAMQLAIQKLPAIVIDSEYVAYGIDSVNRALNVYQQEVIDAQ